MYLFRDSGHYTIARRGVDRICHHRIRLFMAQEQTVGVCFGRIFFIILFSPFAFFCSPCTAFLFSSLLLAYFLARRLLIRRRRLRLCRVSVPGLVPLTRRKSSCLGHLFLALIRACFRGARLVSTASSASLATTVVVICTVACSRCVLSDAPLLQFIHFLYLFICSTRDVL